MTDDTQKEKLKQHFARRVTTQARVILDIWQHMRAPDTDPDAFHRELSAATDKLVRYAQRFEMEKHSAAGKALLATLETWSPDSPLTPTLEAELQTGIDSLSQCTLRRSDQDLEEAPRTFLRTPVYVALAELEMAHRLIKQLDFFGFRAAAFDDSESLIDACSRHKPETILMDVNFGGATLWRRGVFLSFGRPRATDRKDRNLHPRQYRRTLSRSGAGRFPRPGEVYGECAEPGRHDRPHHH